MLLLGLFQLAFWVLFALLFFLKARPYHPFADILLSQCAAAAALGLVVSAALERLHALLDARFSRPAIAAGGLLIGGMLLGFAWYALAAWAGAALDPFEFMPYALQGAVVSAPAQMPLYPATLVLWSLLFLAGLQWRKQQAQEERLLRSEALAKDARLRALRYQLNPHFLFNALNSIGGLAMEAPHRIDRMIRELSSFLRYSLLDQEQLEVPLGEEFNAIAHYLGVEKVRFEDDLDTQVEVEPEAAECLVPAFLVLPLVENAIKHGQLTSGKPLRLHVTGRVEAGTLCIDVRNTGRWTGALHQAKTHGTGTGLQNLRQRLLEHYPERHRFELNDANGWVCASIRIDDGR
jgi:signal transduction histidine kinase